MSKTDKNTDKSPDSKPDKGAQASKTASMDIKSKLEDIKYLDFEPMSTKTTTSTNIDPNDLNTPRSSCIVTSLNDMGVLAAIMVVCEIDAIIMPSGAFGTVAFLKERSGGYPEEVATNVTRIFEGLEVILVQYSMNRLTAKAYMGGDFIKDITPLMVVGNFSEAAEDALIGELDLFELVTTGNAKVDAQHALSMLPSNYVPKKYQQNYHPDQDVRNFNAFPTSAMPMQVAKDTLAKFRKSAL